MRHPHEATGGRAGRESKFRLSAIRLASGKCSRSIPLGVSQLQNQYSHLRNTRQPAQSSFGKSPTSIAKKMFRFCEDEIFWCSSTGLRDGDSLTVLFFRRYMTRN